MNTLLFEFEITNVALLRDVSDSFGLSEFMVQTRLITFRETGEKDKPMRADANCPHCKNGFCITERLKEAVAQYMVNWDQLGTFNLPEEKIEPMTRALKNLQEKIKNKYNL